MPKVESHRPGSFCWMELGTTDQPAAQAFYQYIFGWEWNDSQLGPSETYTIFHLDGLDTAAAFQIGEEAQGVPSHWALYVSVLNVDEAAAKAKTLGGGLIKAPFDAGTNWRMAIVHDPAGAMFCLWQAKAHPGIKLMGEEGAFCWADLNTPDSARAKTFYEQLFGWKIATDPNDQRGYLHIQNGDEYIAGIQPADYFNSEFPPHWLIYFQTADCAGSTAKAKEQGAKILTPPMSIPHVGRFAIVADPQGAVFALYETQNVA